MVALPRRPYRLRGHAAGVRPSLPAGRAASRWSSVLPLVERSSLVERFPAGRACRDHLRAAGGFDSAARCARGQLNQRKGASVPRWSSDSSLVEPSSLVERCPAGRACRDHSRAAGGFDSAARCARGRLNQRRGSSCISLVERSPAGRACRDHLRAAGGFDSAARGRLNQRGAQPAGHGTRSVSATTRRVVGSSRSMPVSSWTRRMR